MTDSANTVIPAIKGRGSAIKYWLIGLSTWLLTIVVCFGVVFNWTTRYDIDINSGQMRKRIMVGSLVLREHIQDTPLSLFVHNELGIRQSPVWRRDTTFHLGGRHHHYEYGGVLFSVAGYMMAMESYRFTKEDKVQAVQAILEWLRKGDKYDTDIVDQVLEPIIAEKKILYPDIDDITLWTCGSAESQSDSKEHPESSDQRTDQ